MLLGEPKKELLLRGTPSQEIELAWEHDYTECDPSLPQVIDQGCIKEAVQFGQFLCSLALAGLSNSDQ